MKYAVKDQAKAVHNVVSGKDITDTYCMIKIIFAWDTHSPFIVGTGSDTISTACTCYDLPCGVDQASQGPSVLMTARFAIPDRSAFAKRQLKERDGQWQTARRK
jgi:hypothetical protein